MSQKRKVKNANKYSHLAFMNWKRAAPEIIKVLIRLERNLDILIDHFTADKDGKKQKHERYIDLTHKSILIVLKEDEEDGVI